MTTREASIDHAAEARVMIRNAHKAVAKATINACLAEAQALATLALVEQQRIANLIALFSLPTKDAEDMATLGVDYLDLAHQIKKGLGL